MPPPRARSRSRPSVGGAVDIQVNGAEQLAALAKRLRQAGNRDLRNELNRGLRRAARPLIADARAHARRTLPQRGGLNEVIARSKFRVSVRTGRDPGVRIIAKGHDARLDTRGRLRHPVFGHRDIPWPEQKITPGWFHVPMRAGARHVRRELLKAISEVAKKI